MKVLVCGSRTYSHPEIIADKLGTLLAEHGEMHLISGGAPGADRCAERWAEGVWSRDKAADRPCRIVWSIYLPDWDSCSALCPDDGGDHRRTHKDGTAYCPVAGPARNQRMLDEHPNIDMVLAFMDKPLAMSKGTKDMVGRAEHAGIPVRVFPASTHTPGVLHTSVDLTGVDIPKGLLIKKSEEPWVVAAEDTRITTIVDLRTADALAKHTAKVVRALRAQADPTEGELRDVEHYLEKWFEQRGIADT
jgi:hypothetical protein